MAVRGCCFPGPPVTCLNLEPADCRALGGCPYNGPELCVGLPSQQCGFRARGSCCRVVDGQAGCLDVSSWNSCLSLGGLIRCPDNCPDTICDNVFPGACCHPDGTCSDGLLESECNQQGGVFQGAGSLCLDIDCPRLSGGCCLPSEICVPDLLESECESQGGAWQGLNVLCEDILCFPPEIEGCREPREPFLREGDLQHSLDMCGVAIAGLAKPGPIHPPPGDPESGWRAPITLHGTRNTATGAPCRRHWVELLKNDDGFWYPMLCSNAWGETRYHFGFASKNLNNQTTEYVEPGWWFFAVGVENPRLWEAKFMHNPHTCGVAK